MIGAELGWFGVKLDYMLGAMYSVNGPKYIFCGCLSYQSYLFTVTGLSGVATLTFVVA